jgi:arginase
MITRRNFNLVLGAALLPDWGRTIVRQRSSEVSIVLAPSNLGLRPTEAGAEPGVWEAPEVLVKADLVRAVDAREIVSLERPLYDFGTQPNTRIRNGLSIKAFSLNLANEVHGLLQKGAFPLVIGGDCSVLLGALYGMRLAGGRGLIHVDGHSDFFHPGNYDTASRLGSAAGMDLALASGRGEGLLTSWPAIEGPLAHDADIVQVGERDAESPAFLTAYGDIVRTKITQITIQRVLAQGITATAEQVKRKLGARQLNKVWLHVDLDVLDQSVMAAVDSPGSPGLTFDQLAHFVWLLRETGRVSGADFSIYDPQRDPDLRSAGEIVRCIADSLGSPLPASVNTDV